MRPESLMSAFQSLTPRPPASLETVNNILDSLVAHYRHDEVLTAVRQIPARDAKFRPMPAWVTSALSEAYRAKGIRELYSHQASTAELVRDDKNVVVVTPTASGKTLCYNLPVLNAVLENADIRALYLFPTKALAQDQLAELQDLAKPLDDSFGVFTYDGDTPNDARKAIREHGHIVRRIRTCCTPESFRITQSGCDCSRTCDISSSMSCTPTAECSGAIWRMCYGD
jgi:ATP-dependent helicase YprA (DUF1998 family)